MILWYNIKKKNLKKMDLYHSQLEEGNVLTVMNSYNTTVNNSDVYMNDTSSKDQTLDLCIKNPAVFRAIILTIYNTIAVLGSMGNIFSFLILHYKSKRSPINFLLKFLAVVDSIFLIFAISRSVLQGSACTSYVRIILESTIVPGTLTITQFLSVWTIVLLGFFRYMAICNPFRVARCCTKNKAKASIAVIFIVGFTIWAPHIFRFSIVKKTSCFVNVTKIWALTESFKYYDLIVAHLGTMFLLPFVLLVYFNTRMMSELYCSCKDLQCFKMRGGQNIQKTSTPISMRPRRSSNQSFHLANSSRETKEITKVVVAIVVVFFISYSMYLIFILESFGYFGNILKRHCSKNILYFVVRTVALLNSSVNFIIYYVLRRSFRRKTKHFFKHPCEIMRNACKQFRCTEFDEIHDTGITMTTYHADNHIEMDTPPSDIDHCCSASYRENTHSTTDNQIHSQQKTSTSNNV